MAMLAVVFGFVAAPLAAAATMAPSVAMTMDMAQPEAVPCAHDSKSCPCCPKPCRDMVACLTDGVAIADFVPAAISTTVHYTKINYDVASVARLPDLAPDPISRPPIV